MTQSGHTETPSGAPNAILIQWEVVEFSSYRVPFQVEFIRSARSGAGMTFLREIKRCELIWVAEVNAIVAWLLVT